MNRADNGSSTRYAQARVAHATGSVGEHIGGRLQGLLTNQLAHEARLLHAGTARATREEALFLLGQTHGQDGHGGILECISFVCQGAICAGKWQKRHWPARSLSAASTVWVAGRTPRQRRKDSAACS